MRLPVETAHETIAAAAAAGITIFDTARAYERNERLLASALRACGAENRARVVTKGGMSRAGGAWVPDGRAKSILADCEASLAALDGLPIDLFLIHAPDPRTPWRTSLRALSRIADERLVAHVGVANVSRAQLDEALELAPVAAVQVALSLRDERALRGGVLERCEEAGIALVAHSPLGGPRGVRGLLRGEALGVVASRRGWTPGEAAIAWLLALSPSIVAIPGARRPETAASSARAARLELDEQDLAGLRPARVRPAKRGAGGEIALVMGIPGAGKSRLAEQYVANGFTRLNRDERGGTLRDLADAVDDRLATRGAKVVLDNTYLTRAERSYVIDAARRHAAAVRCVWLDTPLAQAQVNLVERLLDRFGELPMPEQLRARREPGLLLPTSQMRSLRELEAPSPDEGFAAVERVEFSRTPTGGGAGVFVAAAALDVVDPGALLHQAAPEAPHLVFDWRPGGSPDELSDAAARVAAEVSGAVESAVCPHPGGPPACWCRPPLPGLPLAFARRHGVDPLRSVVVGVTPAHRTLAVTLGARYVSPRATTG